MFSYFKEYFDFKTLIACIMLLALGLLSIYSATFDINNAANFHRQLIWSIVGFVVMMLIAFTPIRTIQRLAFPFYFGTLAILVVILLIGSTVKGSKSWFGIGGLGGQPSEIAKIATILAFASYLSNNEVSITNMKHIIIALAIFAAPMVLVLVEPDLGTTIVFFAALVPLLYWVGASNFFLIAIIGNDTVSRCGSGECWNSLYIPKKPICCCCYIWYYTCTRLIRSDCLRTSPPLSAKAYCNIS
jgi:rod shape determining protein RodA